jgi:hypothetical protein
MSHVLFVETIMAVLGLGNESRTLATTKQHGIEAYSMDILRRDGLCDRGYRVHRGLTAGSNFIRRQSLGMAQSANPIRST